MMTEAYKRPPEIILGGMGVAISNWELCKAAAIAGEQLNEPVLPIVSSTGLPFIMAERLQRGDSNTLRALRALDLISGLKIGEKIIKMYPKVPVSEKHRLLQRGEALVLGPADKKADMEELVIASAFAEISLAKEGHHGPIGINLLEKVQSMHLPTLLGAMMAGVDYVVVGAGVPNQMPKVLEDLANIQEASYRLDVTGLKGGHLMNLDPKRFIKEKLKKPKFFPVISSTVLAKVLNKIDGIDGFIVEGPLAGGHNAPARGKEIDSVTGEPIYGEKDIPDLSVIKAMGKPFYLAGAYSDKLKNAKELGAAGVQVGTLFALCNESGMRKDLAEKVRAKITAGTLEVKCDPNVSPSGYPFMVAQLDGTLSQKEVYDEKFRSCKYRCLAEFYQKEDNSIGFRCPSEPVILFVGKGGKVENAEKSVCLCEALIATAGYNDAVPIVTLGKDLSPVKKIMEGKPDGRYSAEDVVRFVAAHK